MALVSYQTLSQQDYSRFISEYLVTNSLGAKFDFGKPYIERFGAEDREWQPSMVELREEKDLQGHRLLAHLEFRDPEALQSGQAAFPKTMYLELLLPDSEPTIHLNFYWFQKAATRLPESIWLTFNPAVSNQWGWLLEKCGEQVSPLDVVRGGGRQMHAVSKEFSYKDSDHSFTVEPLDSPLLAVGRKSPLNFSKGQPDLSSGIHCNLFNNAWGTNYIMWFGEDMRFRFVLHA